MHGAGAELMAKNTRPHPAARALPSDKAPVDKRVNKPFLPTLFDRLCDDAPLEMVELPERYTANRSRVREIVLRDLQILLNTTDISEQIDAARFPEAVRSTVNFGVPPLAGGYLSEKKWVDIEQMIRLAIERFEPRLMTETLVVRPVSKDKALAHYNVLTFEISGHICMSPYPIEFIVQSAVDLETNRIDLHPR